MINNFLKNWLIFLVVLTNQLESSHAQVPPDISNIAPTILAEGDQYYCPGSPINIVTSFDIDDPDDTEMEAIHIQISEGYTLGVDVLQLTGVHPNIVTSWNATEGKLSLTGIGGVNVLYTELIAAVYDVVYQSNNANVSGEKVFSITIGDANYLPLTGHYYEYISSPGISWTQARDAAASRNYYGLQGYLVTITSFEEKQLSGEQAAGTGWIGGSDAQTEGTWRWVTGPESGDVFWIGMGNGYAPNGAYHFWNQNNQFSEPNDCCSNVTGEENYAHITDCTGCVESSWNDLPEAGGGAGSEYYPFGYVVEYGGMPGDPELNIAGSSKITIPEIINSVGTERCGDGTVVLEAESSVGDVLWFDSLTGGTQLGSGTSFTTPILNSTSNFYALASLNGCTEGIRVPVTATVKTIPTIIGTQETEICYGNSGQIVATPSAGIINWYDAPSGGTILSSGVTFVTPNLFSSTTYYAEVEANDCIYPIREAITVTVIDPPIPAGDALQTFCDVEGAAVSDLVISGANVLWYDASSDGNLLNDTDLLQTGYYYASQTINGCESGSRLEVEVIIYQTVVIDPNLDLTLTECDTSFDGDDTNGRTLFNLTIQENVVLNGHSPSDFEFTYYLDDQRLITILDPIDFENTFTNQQTIYVRIFNVLDNSCYTDYDFEVKVNPLPGVLPNFVFKNCDEDGNPDGFTDYNLEEVNDLITNDHSNFTFIYYESLNDAELGINAINPVPFNNQTSSNVYVRVENEFGCFRISNVDLQVSTTSFTQGYVYELADCDDDEIIDGQRVFDLGQVSYEFISQFPAGQNLNVHYYRSLGDAQLEQNEIVDQANYINETPFSQYVYVRVESDDNGECFGIGPHLLLTVHPRPEFEVDTSEIFCLNGGAIELETYNATGNFIYEWTNGNGDVISDQSTAFINSGGLYSVLATSVEGCESFPYTFNVVESGIASFDPDDITVVDFSSNNSIAINNSGNNLGVGDYEFSLDNEFGPFQDEPFFDHVSAGNHILYVRDKKGCGTAQIDVFVLGFPKFFTPNGDGYNDYWNIKGWNSEYTSASTIYIYDRYGKLLKELGPWTEGWQGTFNDYKLPASDYWFTAQLVKHDGTIRYRQGHFSLVR